MSGTTGRVTQELAEVLSAGTAPGRVTQLLGEVLASEPTIGRATQVMGEVLVNEDTTCRVTQWVSEVLILDSVAGREAATTCQLVRLTLRDGTVRRFAQLDVDVTYAGETYLAAAPFEASASELVRSLSAGQVEFAGLIDNATIAARDILNGLYDGARVEVLRIDFTNPAAGAEVITAGIVGAVSGGQTRFTAEALTPAALLDQSIVDSVTPGCRWRLFSPECGVSAAAWTQSHTITAPTSRTTFTAAGFTESAGWAQRGLVTFTSGPNAGARRDVRTHGAGGVLVLWEPLDQPPTVGDAFTVTAGCDRRLATCRDKFVNVVNFGGFPHIRGNDSAFAYPDAR